MCTQCRVSFLLLKMMLLMAGWCGAFRQVTTSATDNSHCYSCETCTPNAVITNGTTSISESAFFNCEGLESVVIPNSVGSIGESAFQGCASLTSVYIGSNVSVIHDYAFQSCAALQTVVFHNSPASIGFYAFAYCDALETISFGNRLVSIGIAAFYLCLSLESVVLPSSTTAIEPSAFSGCQSLSQVTFGANPISVGHDAFCPTNISTVVIPLSSGIQPYSVFCNLEHDYSLSYDFIISYSPTETPSKMPVQTVVSAPSPTMLPSVAVINIGSPTGQPTSMPTNQPSSQPSGKPSSQPTGKPTMHPTTQPSRQPTAQPTVQPTRRPTGQPSQRPSRQPTVQPTRRPSGQPSVRPTSQPSERPSRKPSGQPSSRPTRHPSAQPTSHPSRRPSGQPTHKPSCQPTRQPSSRPTGQPSRRPSASPTLLPSGRPWSLPSANPTTYPSRRPSGQPNASPSSMPSAQPVSVPTGPPTAQPSAVPSVRPAAYPSAAPSTTSPSSQPTVFPSSPPSVSPSVHPSDLPSSSPSDSPTIRPSYAPSAIPSLSPDSRPSYKPTSAPLAAPSGEPSAFPSSAPQEAPTVRPSAQPAASPTSQPSTAPLAEPSSAPAPPPSPWPSSWPTSTPTASPSSQPSTAPTERPSREPTSPPSLSPTIVPSSQPTVAPSSAPTVVPSSSPSSNPVGLPTRQPSSIPTMSPSALPSSLPTLIPISSPSGRPTSIPTSQPTSSQPSRRPSREPSATPSSTPSSSPSCCPTGDPSAMPTLIPAVDPTTVPSVLPSGSPSSPPSGLPTLAPTSHPSGWPTATPTGPPTMAPTVSPSSLPSAAPSYYPTLAPVPQPSRRPFGDPTSVPSRNPTVAPTLNPVALPTSAPSMFPTDIPTSSPSRIPSSSPSGIPSLLPSVVPTSSPTSQPSVVPTVTPTLHPSARPLSTPTSRPSSMPSVVPTTQPSVEPSFAPTAMPSALPSSPPSRLPISWPTTRPTDNPSPQPSENPSSAPSHMLTDRPISSPSVSPLSLPTFSPTGSPSPNPTGPPTRHPSLCPTLNPSTDPSIRPVGFPTHEPTHQPSNHPTRQPSSLPSAKPTALPLVQPTVAPSQQLTSHPTSRPTSLPTGLPTGQPSLLPSSWPSYRPSRCPSSQPTSVPSRRPSGRPSWRPSERPSTVPSRQPSRQPTALPSTQPSAQPSCHPSAMPTSRPSRHPSGQPTSRPSDRPSSGPSRHPTSQPTAYPSKRPTALPSSQPSAKPVCRPSRCPSGQPTALPSKDPTAQPSGHPSVKPTCRPSRHPSGRPTSMPSKCPTAQPSRQPSGRPTCRPTRHPSGQPTSAPSKQPTVQPSRRPSSRPSARPSQQPTSQPTSRPSPVSFSAVVLPLRIVVAKTSVTVGVTVGRSGTTVFCAALAPSARLMSTFTIKSAGFSGYVAKNSLSVIITIISLFPATNYSVYCFTDDSTSGSMTLTSANATRTKIQTSCCRQIVFSSFPLNIYNTGRTGSSSPFQFYLDTRPTQDLVVFVEVTKVVGPALCAGSTVAASKPSNFTFTPSSLSLAGNFVVSGNIGCYNVTATATSPGSYYRPAVGTVHILSTGTPPSPPIMQSAKFADNGLSITIKFDSNTDMGRTASVLFGCDSLFSFTGATNARCTWATSAIVLASNIVEVVIGDSWIILLPSKIRPEGCLSCEFSAQAKVPVTAPDFPLAPSAVLKIPQEMSSCDDLFIDPTPSSGNSNRPWLKLSWSFTIIPHSDSVEQTIKKFVEANSKLTTSMVITVPNSLIYSTSNITIYFGVTNFLNATAFTTAQVRILPSSTVPRLTVSGTTTLTYVSQSLELTAVAIFPPCTSQSSSRLQYQWTFMNSTGSILTDAKYNNVLNDKRSFQLSPYILIPITSYLVKVAVILAGQSKILTSSTLAVNVLQFQGVKAILDGGSVRTVSTTSTVAFDGSKSYDLDIGQPLGSSLSFSWSCSETYPEYGSKCVFLTKALNSVAQVLTLPGYTVNVDDDTTYSITLFVASVHGFSDFAVSTVTFVPKKLPTVSIFSTLSKYNPDDKILLQARVDSLSDTALSEWTCDKITSTQLGVFSTIAPKTYLTPFNGSQIVYLALSPNSLAAGVTYTFSLAAAYMSSLRQSTASTMVTMNSPPAGGSLSVSPLRGRAFDIAFTMLASSWSDDASDFPILYSMATYTVSIKSLSYVKTAGSVSSVTAQLGQGKAEEDYNVTCVLFVSDSLGCSTYVTARISVLPPLNATVVVAQSTANLLQALSAGDASAVKSIVGATTTFLNAVSCPTRAYCSDLNRNPCQFVANTCGSCLDGFGGTAGDSNSRCVSLRQQNFTSLSIGSACNSGSTDSSCLMGSCVNSICEDSVRECHNDCSGNGDCVYYDNQYVAIQTCYSSNLYCFAACNCSADRYGSDCSMDAAAFSTFRDVRTNLCHSLQKAVALEDVRADTVQSRASSVASVLLDATQISEEALWNCSEVLVSTIMTYPQYVGSSAVAPQLANALSLILNKGTDLPSDLTTIILEALTQLSTSIQATLVVNEDPVNLITGNVRMSAGILSAAAMGTMKVPTSMTEAFENISVPSIQFNVSSASSPLTLNSAVSVSIRQLMLPLFPSNYSTDSTAVGVQISESLEYDLTLVNREPILYYNSSLAEVRTVQCDWSQFPYNVSRLCPDGTIVNITCSGYKGNTSFHCPELYHDVPVCAAISRSQTNVLQASPESICRVRSYSSTQTVCTCRREVSAQRRNLEGVPSLSRQLRSGQGDFDEFTSDSALLADNFVENVNAFSDLNLRSIESNRTIFTVLCVIVAVAIMGLIFSLRLDRKEVAAEAVSRTKRGQKYLATKDYMNALLPLEYTGQSAFVIYFRKLLFDHDWLCLLLPYDPQRDYRTASWLKIMGKVVNTLFVDTVLATLVFADDGQCEAFTTRAKCYERMALNQVDQLCQWDKIHHSCSFNQSIGSTAFTTLILTSVITVLTIPFDQIIDILVGRLRIFIHVHVKPSKIDDANTFGGLSKEEVVTDLAHLQTLQSLMLRAAGLVIMQRSIDGVPVATEAKDLLEYYVQLETRINESKWVELWEAHQFSGYVEDSRGETFTKYNAQEISHNKKFNSKLIRRLESCRKQADAIDDSLHEFSNEHDKNCYLIKMFLLYSVSKGSRRFAENYFFSKSEISEVAVDRYNNKLGKLQQYLSVVIFAGYCLFALTFVFVFAIRIGPKATVIWLKGSSVSLVMEIVLLLPFKSWVNRILIASFSSRDIRINHGLLRERCSAIMKRSHGLIRATRSLVQHFNPACRAARKHPELAASRLLMS
jgi:hypothetical protein